MTRTEVRVVNEHGKDVAHNGKEIGEIIVKGQGVVDQSSNMSAVEGWVRTGDKGTIDKNGKIHVVEPMKDITSSETPLSSIDVEKILLSHPAVQEAAIIPVPDQELGEIVHGFIVLHKGQTATERELMDFCLNKMDKTECPKRITFMEELPKTVSGKILKTQLKA